ncbi:Integrase [Rhizobiales bacterium GAS191]|nr:Integrase [Rhizobiales bacterium GAS191]
MRISTHLQVMQAIKSPPGRHSVAGGVKGLYLIVSKGKSGGRNVRWVYRYTKPSTGRVSELGLGGVDVLSLERAREAAQRHRTALKRDGKDPVEAKRQVKAERVRQQRTTFGALAADYITENASGWSASTVYHVRLLLQRHAAALADKPITSISSDDIVTALKPLRDHAPEQLWRVLGKVSRVFDYAKGRELCDRNPAEWRGRMQLRYPKRNGQRPHHTAMPYEQVPAFVARLRAVQAQNSALSPWAIEFLLLTACRVSEVTKMRWVEVDEEKQLFTIPAQRMKAGKEHRVPLCSRAMDILAVQPKDGEWVWQGMKEGKPLCDRSLYQFLTLNMGLKGEATLHGFRATFRTWAGNETHFDRVTCELALGHAAGNAVELAYRRGDELTKRRKLMEAWAAYCDANLQP